MTKERIDRHPLLEKWLTYNRARFIRQVQEGERILSYYWVRDKLIVLDERESQNEWDVYAPLTTSNSVADVIAAMDALID